MKGARFQPSNPETRPDFLVPKQTKFAFFKRVKLVPLYFMGHFNYADNQHCSKIGQKVGPHKLNAVNPQLERDLVSTLEPIK